MFEEELQHHLLMGLDHLKFAREMLIRVGTPAGVEAFNRHGWSFGEEVYTGLPETQVVEDQMNTVFEMTEARLAADLYFIDYLNEGREEWYRGVLHAGGSRVRDPNELPLHDLDFAHALVVSSSDAGLVENYRRGLAARRPGLEFFIYDPEPPKHLSARQARRRPPPREPTRPNFLVFVDPWDDNPQESLYDISRCLVGVWKDEQRRLASRKSRIVRAGTGGFLRSPAQTFGSRTTFGRDRPR